MTSAQASHTIPGCFTLLFVLCLRPRFIVSLNLDPRLWVCPNIWSCTDYHTLLFVFALDIQRLCLLGFWYPSQIESTRLWLRPRYSDALHPLLWLHPQIASTTNHQTLGSRHRYLGPNGTLGQGDSALPCWSEKNQPWSQ